MYLPRTGFFATGQPRLGDAAVDPRPPLKLLVPLEDRAEHLLQLQPRGLQQTLQALCPLYDVRAFVTGQALDLLQFPRELVAIRFDLP
jgi:hypothetical protein